MREWTFDNGIIVRECEYDYLVHCFRVYDGDKYLGVILPDTFDDFKLCISGLDNGEDPITGGWQDGCGHDCTREGW